MQARTSAVHGPCALARSRRSSRRVISATSSGTARRQPRARRADRLRGPDAIRCDTRACPRRAGIALQQFVDGLVPGAPSVCLRDRPLVDHVHRRRFDETLAGAVAATGHDLRPLPSSERHGDRTVGDAALESGFEEHRARPCQKGRGVSAVTLVKADCSAGTNNCGAATHTSCSPSTGHDPRSWDRLRQSQLAMRWHQGIALCDDDSRRNVDLADPFVGRDTGPARPMPRS